MPWAARKEAWKHEINEIMRIAEIRVECKRRRALTKTRRPWPCVDNGVGRCCICGNMLERGEPAFVPPPEYAPPSLKARVLAWLAGRPHADGSFRALAAARAAAATCSGRDASDVETSEPRTSIDAEVAPSTGTKRTRTASEAHVRSSLSTCVGGGGASATHDVAHAAADSGPARRLAGSPAKRRKSSASAAGTASAELTPRPADEPYMAAARQPSGLASSSSTSRATLPDITLAAPPAAGLCTVNDASVSRFGRLRKAPVQLYTRLFNA